jgi:hypothetical protein
MDILKLSDWLVKGALLFPQLVAQVVGKTIVLFSFSSLAGSGESERNKSTT